MTRQVVLHRIRDDTAAVPSVPGFDGRAGNSNQPVVLNIFLQLVEDVSHHTRAGDSSCGGWSANQADRRDNDDRIELAGQSTVSPGPCPQPPAPQSRRLDLQGLDYTPDARANDV